MVIVVLSMGLHATAHRSAELVEVLPFVSDSLPRIGLWELLNESIPSPAKVMAPSFLQSQAYLHNCPFGILSALQ